MITTEDLVKELSVAIKELEKKFDSKLDKIDNKIDKLDIKLETKIDEYRKEQRSDFRFLITTFIVLILGLYSLIVLKLYL